MDTETELKIDALQHQRNSLLDRIDWLQEDVEAIQSEIDYLMQQEDK